MDSIVSIIIPVYNAEKTLRRCVESLVYGVEKNIEVILVDDCSMDGSWKLCQQLQSEFKSVKSIQNKKNSGVSYTRNHGLNEVNSPYVMFVDSDDWVSKYFVSSLLYAAKIYKDGQILCGFHYIDRLTNNKIDYQWNSKNHKDVIVIQGVSLFDAVDKIMLQNVWNKIFIYDIIREHNIRFDEMQNMGEDFQFVLEYMVAADLHKCIVLNQPLYYYVRANQTSLMSKYGWASEKQEIQRLKLLRTLCEGDTKVLQRRLEKQIVDTKENLAYHVVRTKHKSTKEKITRIEEIFDDGRGKQYYKKQIKIKKKEKVASTISGMKYFVQRIKWNFQRIKRERLIGKVKSKLKNKQFSIISQNCIGGVFYHDMGIKFLSPTINLYFEQPDFVRFVLEIEKYLSMELLMEWGEEYPVGRLGDITIHFMHYESCTEAEKSWNKRKERVNLNKIIVLSTDMEGFDDTVFEMWNQIMYPKVLFTAHKEYIQEKSSVYFSKYEVFNQVLDLIPKREFYKKNILVDVVNKN